jgi:hypothetical protein
VNGDHTILLPPAKPETGERAKEGAEKGRKIHPGVKGIPEVTEQERLFSFRKTRKILQGRVPGHGYVVEHGRKISFCVARSPG